MYDYTPIPEFEQYGIRIDGDVMNLETGRRLRQHESNGHVYVGLNQGGMTYPRLVSRLVALTYLPSPWEPRIFNTIIHHDYDHKNNHVNNLSWRPRWFALKYYEQGMNLDDPTKVLRVMRPIKVRHGVEVFPTSKFAAITYGVLETEIFTKLDSGEGVFPDGTIFDSY
jgi:hypothetical protein